MMRSRSAKMTTLSALVVVALFLMAAPASAQTSSEAITDADIQVQIWPEVEPQSTIMIVGAVLSAETPLPALIELPVPTDAQVVWAGEVSGSGVENDIQAAEPEIVDVEGGRVIRFEAQTYRAVQYEAYVTSPTYSGDQVSQTFQWVQAIPTGEVSFAWRLPANTTDVELDPEAPGAPETNQTGEKLYTLRSIALEPGASAAFSASYSYVEAGGTEDEGIGVLPIIIGLLVLAVFVLIVVYVRQMPSAAHDGEDDEDSEDEEASEDDDE